MRAHIIIGFSENNENRICILYSIYDYTLLIIIMQMENYRYLQ